MKKQTNHSFFCRIAFVAVLLLANAVGVRALEFEPLTITCPNCFKTDTYQFMWDDGGDVKPGYYIILNYNEIPTCTTGGQIKYTCTNPDCKILKNILLTIRSLGHNWTGWVEVPVCDIEPAHKVRTCQRCGLVEKTRVNGDYFGDLSQRRIVLTCNRGHTRLWREGEFTVYKSIFTDSDICTIGGGFSFECPDALEGDLQWDMSCDGGIFVSYDGGHQWNESLYNHSDGGWYSVGATCSFAQHTERSCIICGYKQLKDFSGEPLGHDWGEPFGEYVAPTCTTVGGYDHSCQRCGMTVLDNSVAALGHDWGEWTSVPPTCTQDGYDRRICQREGCGLVEKAEVIPAIGHTWGQGYHCIRCDADLPAISSIKGDGTQSRHQAFPIDESELNDVVLGFEDCDTWYYVDGTVGLNSLRLIDRTANIILAAGSSLTITEGISVENGSLNIYEQTTGTGAFNSAISAHGDVNIYGGSINCSNINVGGDITIGWTHGSDSFCANSISAGGTITVAEGKVWMNKNNDPEILYGDRAAIDPTAIEGKGFRPKTDVVCYVDGMGELAFRSDDITELTSSTDLSAYKNADAAERWFVVKQGGVIFGPLEIYGTTNIILADNASVTFSSSETSPIYTEGTLNIYGGLRGNGQLTATSGSVSTAIYVCPLIGPNGIPGYLNIYGGQVNAISNGGTGIRAATGITLSLTCPDNSITANSYGSGVTIADGKTLYDDEGNDYTGKYTVSDVSAIDGKTLHTYDLRSLTLSDDAINTPAIEAAALISNEGKPYHVTLAGRTLYLDCDWNTLCLPFAVDDIDDTSLKGFTVMEMDGSQSYLSDGTLYLNFKEVNTIEAGKPYIVKKRREVNGDAAPIFVSTDGKNSTDDLINGRRWNIVLDDIATAEFKALTPVYMSSYTLTAGPKPDYTNPNVWTLKAKLNEDDRWTTIDMRSGSGVEGEIIIEDDALPLIAGATKTYTIQKPSVYQYFRFDVSLVESPLLFSISSVDLWMSIQAWNSTIQDPSFMNVTVVDDEPAEINSRDGKFRFVGTYDRKTIADEDRSILFLGARNTLYYPDGTGQGVTIGACRAYFQIDTSADVRAMVLAFGDDDTVSEPSDIVNVSNEDRESTSHHSAIGIYTIDGRRVASDYDKQDPYRLPKGMYIVNGRKVLIK